MEGGGNRWTNVQGDPVEVSSIQWRSQLHPEFRQRIVNKIVDTLKRNLPAEDISKLNRVSVQFEEKIYTGATSQCDYLRKIAKKMLTIEQKTQSGVAFQLNVEEVNCRINNDLQLDALAETPSLSEDKEEEETPSIEWRSQLHPKFRQRIINKIANTLKRHLPINAAEDISDLNLIALRFEEKIYTGATSQSDYLRKISMKMLTMEQKTHRGGTANPIASGSINENQ